MPCEHGNGSLQVYAYESGAWRSHCLMCGEDCPAADPGFPADAGACSSRALLFRSQRRYPEAADAFRHAAAGSGDVRFRFAALVCSLGVTWCGREFQPTFGAAPLPEGPLSRSGDWQAVEAAAGQLGAAGMLTLSGHLAQLEEILTCIRSRESRCAYDVFLCYRRTGANVQTALRLWRDLTDAGLRIFCADVSTRGKTQTEFEAEVYHALHTAEYLALLPGEGGDALTPWLRNELERAAAPHDKRFILATPDLPDMPGVYLPLEELRSRLIAAAADMQPERLYARALEEFCARRIPQGTALLRRAAVRGYAPAQLLIAEMYDEGLLLPRDREHAAGYRRLIPEPSAACIQQVADDMAGLEAALQIVRREAALCLVADVSDAGFASSLLLTKALFSALNADRQLAGSNMCIIGYDRHARVLEASKALARYGLPDAAAHTLRTFGESAGEAYAAKGLRCVIDQLRRAAAGRTPAVILLRPCLTADPDSALQAAVLSLEACLTPGAFLCLRSADEIPGCIAALRALLSAH